MRTSFLLVLLASTVACTRGGPVETGDTEVSDTGDTNDTDTSDTDTSDTETDTPPPTELGALIHPLQPVLQVNASTKLRARMAMSDRSYGPAPTGAQWLSSDERVATIDSNGTLTAVGEGRAWIHLNTGGERISAPVYVIAADDQIDGVTVNPSNPVLTVGGSQVLSAMVRAKSAVAGDVAPDCTFTSSDPGIALAGAAGVITGVSEGDATITVDCPNVGLIGYTREVSVQVTNDLSSIIGADVPPSIAITDLSTVPFPLGIVSWGIGISNAGGPSLPFTVDLFTDAASPPSSGPGDIRMRLPGLDVLADTSLVTNTTFSGARPATVQPWILIDAAGVSLDVDTSDNLAWPSTIDLPKDLTADIAVGEPLGISFGPGSAGISITLSNNGPDTLTDVTVWVDVDKPGVTSVYQLDTAAAEQSVVVESIASGESFDVAVDHYDSPFGTTWNTCAWVLMEGVVDDDLSNNWGCREWTE